MWLMYYGVYCVKQLNRTQDNSDLILEYKHTYRNKDYGMIVRKTAISNYNKITNTYTSTDFSL